MSVAMAAYKVADGGTPDFGCSAAAPPIKRTHTIMFAQTLKKTHGLTSTDMVHSLGNLPLYASKDNKAFYEAVPLLGLKLDTAMATQVDRARLVCVFHFRVTELAPAQLSEHADIESRQMTWWRRRVAAQCATRALSSTRRFW